MRVASSSGAHGTVFLSCSLRALVYVERSTLVCCVGQRQWVGAPGACESLWAGNGWLRGPSKAPAPVGMGLYLLPLAGYRYLIFCKDSIPQCRQLWENLYCKLL